MSRGHLYRRTTANGSPSRWHAVIDLPKTNGRRRQITRTFDTRREAEAWLAATATENSATTGSPTLAEYLPGWLDGKAALRPSTRASYRAHLDKYLIPHLGHLVVDGLRAEHVETWHRTLLADGMTPNTLRRVHATLSSALSTAVRRQIIATNPITSVGLPRAEHPQRTVWTVDQAATFLDGVRDDRLHTLWRLALVRGLRRGELVGLRWTDLDLDNGQLHVAQTLVWLNGQTHQGPPKSRAGTRTIQLDQGTVADLRVHRRQQAAERLRAGLGWFDTGLVFTRPDGCALAPGWVTWRFSQLVTGLRLPRIRLHDLRHTSATLGLASGETLKEISARLGHATVGITADLYTDVDTNLAQESARRLAALLETAPRDDQHHRDDDQRAGRRNHHHQDGVA